MVSKIYFYLFVYLIYNIGLYRSILIKHLLPLSNVKEPTVRYRVCQIIAELMGLLSENIEIGYEILS